MRLVIAIALLVAVAVSTIAQDAPQPTAREALLAQVGKTWLKDVKPEDRAARIEFLEIPQSIREHIVANEWEKAQLERFTKDRAYALVAAPDGDYAIHFRGPHQRSTRKLDAARARILRRLYNDAAFAAPCAPELEAWLKAEVDVQAVFSDAVARACDDVKFRPDGDTLRRARVNLLAEGTSREAIARALGALAKVDHAPECCWAAIWLISRMDLMTFHREKGEGSVNDLVAMDARCFFENVWYAVKARHDFAWGCEVPDKDFLNYVLSPRGTGEPLQRWRRHFYEALAPELVGKTRDEAINLATTVVYDFYQYEGDTTWEDFGMLTALAVHEGRCEDCSNVECCMLRAVCIPGAQAFTPWWGHGDGNHAWTWIPSFGKGSGDGAGAVKVYTKTWDGLDDVTDQNTPVTRFECDAPADATEKLQLLVWNHDEWRLVARAMPANGKAVFEKVGNRKHFALLVRTPGGKDRMVVLGPKSEPRWLNNAEKVEGGADFTFEKQSPLGEFQPDRQYQMQVWTTAGWQDLASERVSTGALKFKAAQDRLYRLKAEGINGRPFTIEEIDGEFAARVR
ncbi:MAG: hypothetical protein KF754_07900 [Planctomycetes bacterium]|nr:hypothetical protein [Planctomycetota bacterium]